MNETDRSITTEQKETGLRAAAIIHFRIARVDHWVKNVFILPGILVAVSMSKEINTAILVRNVVLGMLSAGLIASSNYVLNEILDAPFDRLHPRKRLRPIASRLVSIPLAYVQWLVLMAAGLGVAYLVNWPFVLTMVALLAMGSIYNVRPVRSKDIPYLDVLSEAVNNPIRFIAGWFMVDPHTVAPLSLLLSYWMVGCYFMAAKRFAEYREIGDPERASKYRWSFGYYNEKRLLVSILFYSSVAMLFFGTFMIRYRFELIVSFPFVAWVMAEYLSTAFKKNSAVQAPEKLYREPVLMVSVVLCALVMGLMLFVDIPALDRLFPPTIQTLFALVLSPEARGLS